MSSKLGVRSSPRYGSKQSLALPDDRLSVIDEDAETPPVVRSSPPKAHNRSFSRRWYPFDPPRHSFEKSPPPYSVWNITGPKGEKLTDVRNNKHIARRGGWARLLVIGVIVIAVVVALVVGLVLGLHKKSQSSAAAPAALSSPIGAASTNTSFPEGSYTLTTFLDTISTNCTSNAATWRCYPYTTYGSSPSGSTATFNWIITASNSSSRNEYTISSTDNPFAINFTNASLALVDPNSPTERYTFSVSINKVVVPQVAITGDNSMAACFFNSTHFEASLYTNLPKSYPANSTSTVSASSPLVSTSAGSFEAWPYAVEVTQSINGGSSVPECFKTLNGTIGSRITEDPTVESGSGDVCSCEYKNWDP